MNTINDIRRLKNYFYIAIILVICSLAYAYSMVDSLNSSNITYINATNLSYSGFAWVLGNITALNEINGDKFEGNESAGTPYYIHVTFTNVTSFDYVDVSQRYFSSTGTKSTHDIHLKIWCEEHSEYVVIKEYMNDEFWYSRTFAMADAQHYIMPNGTVLFEIEHDENGNAFHRYWLDVFRLIQSPKYRNDTINLYNTTYINTSTNMEWINTSLNTKVNKSGDTMTGTLNMSKSGGVLTRFGLRYPMLDLNTTPYNGYSLSVERDGTTAVSSPHIDYFRKNSSTALKENDEIGNFYAWGSDGSSYNIGASISFIVDGVVSNYSTPSRIAFSTRPNGNTGSYPIERLQIRQSGNVTITMLNGSNNAAACLDGNGTLYRSKNSTSNYLTC